MSQFQCYTSVFQKMKTLCFLILLNSAVSLSDLCDKCLCTIPTQSISCKSINLTLIPSYSGGLSFFVIDFSNNLLTSLHPTTILRSSRKTVRRIILSHNLLDGLPTHIFRGTTSLEYIDFSWNKITTTITLQLLSDVHNLDYLSFSHNEIQCLDNDAFQRLGRLTEIDFSYNRFTSHSTSSCFPREAICCLKNLIVLRVSSNYLPEIFNATHDKFFSCLPNLTLLEASNCGIKTLSRKAFDGLDQLTSLDLSNNFISQWPSEVLEKVISLVYLDIGQNLISSLPSHFLTGCPKVSHLVLRNNELRFVDYRWLSRLDGTKNVTNISSNEIFSRIEYFLSLFPNGKILSTSRTKEMYIDWSGNPWLCDCQILSFVSWLVNEGAWLANTNGYHDVICYDPVHRRGSPLFDVYVTGAVDSTTVSNLLHQCLPDTITSEEVLPTKVYNVSSADTNNSVLYKTSSETNAIFKNFLLTSPTLFQQGNFSSSVDSDSEHLKLIKSGWRSHISTIVVVCIAFDAVVSILLVFYFKKRGSSLVRATTPTNVSPPI